MNADAVVLLVDDEPEFLDLVAKRLDRRGMTVRRASSGQAAVDAVSQAAADARGKTDVAAGSKAGVDVVVLDVLMPGMDGLTALSMIRKASPRTQVIILTGHASLDIAYKGMLLGAYDVMLKPVAFNELLFKIQEALDAKGKSGDSPNRSMCGNDPVAAG